MNYVQNQSGTIRSQVLYNFNFDMVQAINPYQLPKRLSVNYSGYLPNYLYDLKALDQNISLKQWYQIATLTH